MTAVITLVLLLTALLTLFYSVAYLVNNGPRLGKMNEAELDGTAAKLLAERKMKVRLAFGCAALMLLAHRAYMTHMLMYIDFSNRDAQAFFGMSWWFMDPLAGFPVILGTMPFAKDMLMPRFINSYYIPLAIAIYSVIIYGLWRLARHAFASPKPPAPQDKQRGNESRS